MRNFSLDPETNDMFLDSNGDFAGVNSRIKDIAQLLICKIQTFLGEVPTNTSLGVDYYGIIFEEFLIEQTKINEFIRVILDTDGVKNIEDFNLSPNKSQGEIGYDFTIVTDAGDIQFQDLI